jgi:transposase
LEVVKEVSPLLADMHNQKSAFRDIFDSEDWTDGTLKLLDWLAQNQEKFPKRVGTICRWFGEVVGYFDNRSTSGL